MYETFPVKMLPNGFSLTDGESHIKWIRPT
jgi:hypothetical protein